MIMLVTTCMFGKLRKCDQEMLALMMIPHSWASLACFTVMVYMRACSESKTALYCFYHIATKGFWVTMLQEQPFAQPPLPRGSREARKLSKTRTLQIGRASCREQIQ